MIIPLISPYIPPTTIIFGIFFWLYLPNILIRINIASDIKYQEILNYLTQNYQTADLASTADTIHFSKQYVCRIVKEKTGKTFNSLLMNIRLDKAAQYLNETDLTLENIGYLCGFTAASHFSKLFKQRFGCPPSAYRKNIK